jgi:transglutaminase-like putative cysteine protease
VQLGRERLPWLAVFVVVSVVGCVLGLMTVGPPRAARVLGEWLPTSGGTGGYNPFARGGVNDGDDEVKGDNARSTGMTQTDTFLDSPLPSRYDVANDLYGEPFKPKEQERAIALDWQSKGNESQKPPADNLRPNREFPTTRKSPRQPRDPSDRAARARFEVHGRTPLHIRVAAYDAFDGRTWQEAPFQGICSLLEKEPHSCWMKLQERPPPAIFAETESHQLKITHPSGSLVPTPPHLTRFRLGRVDQPCFFAWAQDRILRLAERKTPSGIIVETECRTVDPRLLDSVSFSVEFASDRLQYTGLPPNLHPEVAALAYRWAGEQASGWPQIAAVVQRLRADFTLDPTARVPAACVDPLGYFLLYSRRGPDYQFATAAAVLRRVLGYPTRLVSGFYASPDHYDAVTRHTPVVQEDLHFWAEVLLPSRDWLVIEATPGYEVLGPKYPLSERLWAVMVTVALWAWSHSVELSLGLVALAGLWWQRREWLDILAAALWRWFPGRTWRQRVRRAWLLLERRGRWAGRPRPASQTLATWVRTTFTMPVAPDAELNQLTRMAEWATYASDLAPPWSEDEVQTICRRVLDDWTLRRWRRSLT